METSFRKLVLLSKNVLNELAKTGSNRNTVFDDRNNECTKQKKCVHLLKTIEALVEAENNCELELFNNPTANKDRVVEQKKAADDIMKLLHSNNMISSFEYASYLVEETAAEPVDLILHKKDTHLGCQHKQQSEDLRRLRKLYSNRRLRSTRNRAPKSK